MAVEPLAKRLGATKGSFYWHFPDRASLLEAALALYEAEATESVISNLQEAPGPAEQLDALFELVFRDVGGDSVYHALLANAEDPTVVPVLERITTRRLDYLSQVMASAGWPVADARARGVLAYTLWLGLTQTERAMGGRLFRSKAARARYLQQVRSVALPPFPDSPAPRRESRAR